jgi:hypothetical protein
MAQDTVTLPIRPTSATQNIRGSHAHMIERLQKLPPYLFDAWNQPDGDQLDLQADTLRFTLMAVEQYAIELMKDAAYHSHAVQLEPRLLRGLFSDIVGDLCGTLSSAADTARDEAQSRKASYRAA